MTPILAFLAMALIAADIRYRRNVLLLGAVVCLYYAALLYFEV